VYLGASYAFFNKVSSYLSKKKKKKEKRRKEEEVRNNEIVWNMNLLLQNLNHKNIVKYLGSLKTKTHLHIILE
jgi:hypothetical protein